MESFIMEFFSVAAPWFFVLLIVALVAVFVLEVVPRIFLFFLRIFVRLICRCICLVRDELSRIDPEEK